MTDWTELRECLEGMPCPICTKNVSDEDLKKLAYDIDTMVLSRFGTNNLSYPKVNYGWWEALEHLAVSEYGMEYYEDMEEE